MSSKAGGLKSAIDAFIQRRGIEAGMDQNLMKEAIHLHLLSALSEAGILQHVIFQGGTALRLCYGGERYSEDLDFVCGKAGAYLKDVEFDALVDKALETTKRTLQRDFDIDATQIALKRPAQPELVKGSDVNVAAWQIVVPVNPTPKTPKSRIKIEFANVPSYDSKPLTVSATPGLVQIQDVILNAETPNEILADKAVALTARAALKFRDVWDVWFLVNKLGATPDREMVLKKFADYGTTDIAVKANARLDELAKDATATAFYAEMKRFLPSARVAQMSQMNLQRTMLSDSADLIRKTVV
ncbi:nucleotidyl transferase AbiEii/AbiGii toxin family protein [Tardiphaga sp. 538_B7_N1_4]|jgi:predicted nucleotidyltransferase component of viral defense system|uniref:nucleotidyl transferase AbiEii/AbiGii toxin family protein n=1 Tax=unclassified Tardiphaga TaxID=2631404 RepID=UPI001B89E7B3|nr:nucleotidyl transferase AbiEii/AbiGii toxin family protein [Bradyrhizobium diazoefficiens]MBR0962491.1 nucleotidyl transferase AbiEii/AbiGii toxin family protein [Bradyrhizobium diazoefficiens]MBR0980654.1 nucleotidyl transferase AbiEii/AbiGii toxin family protein [Bradyrhizobium diazoefficiens]MBR1010201.1 nucleotidyl transferase AbiEii/AbiGii toxin family protein [Bradyrhizobium diazoefficiens]MBR1016789.1 nucleotidyl transferase AbiEii/AbiGii toxin family protein [Bradyrhizobium diazoeffi